MPNEFTVSVAKLDEGLATKYKHVRVSPVLISAIKSEQFTITIPAEPCTLRDFPVPPYGPCVRLTPDSGLPPRDGRL